MTESQKVAFLGGGKMGEALLSGLIRAGARRPQDLLASCRPEGRARELADRYGIATTLSNPDAVAWADTLVLTVKPQDMERLCEQIASEVRPEQLVVSVAAGIRTSFIERRIQADVPVVRVMSNVPVLVDEAMSGVAAGRLGGGKELRGGG